MAVVSPGLKHLISHQLSYLKLHPNPSSNILRMQSTESLLLTSLQTCALDLLGLTILRRRYGLGSISRIRIVQRRSSRRRWRQFGTMHLGILSATRKGTACGLVTARSSRYGYQMRRLWGIGGIAFLSVHPLAWQMLAPRGRFPTLQSSLATTLISRRHRRYLTGRSAGDLTISKLKAPVWQITQLNRASLAVLRWASGRVIGTSGWK